MLEVQILVGDVRERLKTLPDRSVHCVVTSPPYFGLRDYQVKGQIGLEPSLEDYVQTMVDVFRAVWRVLRDDGTCWLNLGDSYNNFRSQMGPGQAVHGRDVLNGKPAPLSGKRGHQGFKDKDLLGVPWRVAFALQAAGWYLRQDIVWAKPNPMPESVTDRCTKSHEYMFLLTKKDRYFYDAFAIQEDSIQPDRKRADAVGGASHKERQQHSAGGVFEGASKRNRRSVWTVATKPFAGAHFATFPPDLIEPCVLAGTSEHGCCAACGSPFGRMVEKNLVATAKVSHGTRPDSRDFDADAQDQGANRTKDGHVPGMARADLHLGWRQTCNCLAALPVPCTVLDPFGGAGTTALVAQRHGRHAILVELNPDYAAMARDRITADGTPAALETKLAQLGQAFDRLTTQLKKEQRT